jgi:hypothetical protein
VEKPDATGMILKDGTIPNLLLPVLSNLQTDNDGNSDATLTGLRVIEQVIETAATHYDEIEPIINQIVSAAMIEPIASPEQVAKLPMRDRLHIANWVIGKEFGDLSRFLTSKAKRAFTIPTQQGAGDDASSTNGSAGE